MMPRRFGNLYPDDVIYIVDHFGWWYQNGSGSTLGTAYFRSHTAREIEERDYQHPTMPISPFYQEVLGCGVARHERAMMFALTGK